MKILILGGDKRYLPIIKYFNDNKHQVDTVGFEGLSNCNININDINISKYEIIILPVGGINNDFSINTINGKLPLPDGLFDNLNDNVIIFTGLITDNVIKCIPDKKIISFLNDDEVKEKNNDVTIEGIIDDIKNKKKEYICILGYGNIGKKLYNMLVDMGIDVVVGVIDENDYIDLNGRGFYTTDEIMFESVLEGSDVVINTVPKNILNEKLISNISNECYILDIASYPHGIDQNLVQKYNLNYNLYLGIPGKYDPERTGHIILKKLVKTIGGEK